LNSNNFGFVVVIKLDISPTVIDLKNVVLINLSTRLPLNVTCDLYQLVSAFTVPPVTLSGTL
jgi:hypothetical protein